MAADLLTLVALVIALAVAAEMLGDRLDLPNFLFFVGAGLVVGPPGLGLIHHGVFGDALSTLVGLAVAFIIYHSGFGITLPTLREAPPTVYPLVTAGLLVTFLAATATTYLLMDVLPGTAVLIGALVVPTGTTVIEPLLASVSVREDLAATLEIEATVSEVTGGVLAVTAFQAITLGEPDPVVFVAKFAGHLTAGVVVGAVVGVAAAALYKLPEHAPERAPNHGSQLFLATAVVTYALAEVVAQKAGVPAVATAGAVLGNADLPYRERIETFEETFTTFVIAFVFVVFASFAEPAWLRTVGVEGLAVAAVVILVVRPLAVFLSTAGSALSARDKLFLSAASPRGIIPAGVATLLAITIQDGNPEMAASITGTVLLVILVSAAGEGLLAERLADRLGVTVDTSIVVGGGRLGLALADRYTDRGEAVHLVESDSETLEEARNAGYPVYGGDAADEAVLRDAGAGYASRIVAATDDDETNLEVARLADDAFDADVVQSRVNDEANRQRFEDLDVEWFTGSQLELWSLDHLTEEPAPDWLVELTRTGRVQTVTVTEEFDEDVGGLERSLPDRTFVVARSRDGETTVPTREDPVRSGDRLTIIGRAATVEEAIERLRGGK
jgi:NhaP-type Na+/H+ or K+/H+ antiporter/Trk K+ transport system NAD-binding subunit